MINYEIAYYYGGAITFVLTLVLCNIHYVVTPIDPYGREAPLSFQQVSFLALSLAVAAFWPAVLVVLLIGAVIYVLCLPLEYLRARVNENRRSNHEL